jgi:hypothetical protein
MAASIAETSFVRWYSRLAMSTPPEPTSMVARRGSFGA